MLIFFSIFILFSLQFISTFARNPNLTLLFTLEGQVKGEEFLYYKINQHGNLYLVLESLVGDADIYISDKTAAPSFDPQQYDLHSATCGNDTIFIQSSMKRPIAVGIYGHFMHETSLFHLNIYSMRNFDSDDDEAPSEENNKQRARKQKATFDTNQKTHRKHGIFNGFEMIFEIFELFFL